MRNGFGGQNRFGQNKFGQGNNKFGQNNNKNSMAGETLRKPLWDFPNLSPFAKDFYVPHPNVANR